jgi:hypothetical protein
VKTSAERAGGACSSITPTRSCKQLRHRDHFGSHHSQQRALFSAVPAGRLLHCQLLLWLVTQPMAWPQAMSNQSLPVLHARSLAVLQCLLRVAHGFLEENLLKRLTASEPRCGPSSGLAHPGLHQGTPCISSHLRMRTHSLDHDGWRAGLAAD